MINVGKEITEKKVSVIIPCYNAAQYLDTCFASLKNQTIGMENLEIIFVDDAATDATGTMLDHFQEEFPDSVKVLHLKENLRQGGARNRGIELASGEYLAFLDADDWMMEDAYKKAYTAAHGGNLDILQFDRINYGDGLPEKVNVCELEGNLSLEDDEVRKMFLMGGMFSFGCTNKLFRRELVHAAQANFAEKVIFEEPLFVYPQLFYAKRVGNIRDALYCCRIHGNSTMTSEAYDSDRLLNHARVQLETWKRMKQDTQIFAEYRNEIEYYFLATYYAETLCMAGSGVNLHPADVKNFQETVQEECPNWKKNPYLYNDEGELTRQILSTAEYDFTPEELRTYCRQLYLLTENEAG